MDLVKFDIEGIDNIYAMSTIQKEFFKSVNEKFVKEPPWQRYQKKLIQDLAVLSIEKEKAIDLPQYEKLEGVDKIYSIRHPETKKNVRVLYTITEDSNIVLLTVFLEKNDADYKRAVRVAKSRLNWLNN